jgi:hypothetical protein
MRLEIFMQRLRILTDLKAEFLSKRSGVVAMGSDGPPDSGGKGRIFGGGVNLTELEEIDNEKDIFPVGQRDSFHVRLLAVHSHAYFH